MCQCQDKPLGILQTQEKYFFYHLFMIALYSKQCIALKVIRRRSLKKSRSIKRMPWEDGWGLLFLHRLERFQEARVTISSALKSWLHSNMCNPCVISLRDRKHCVPPLISTPGLTEWLVDCFTCRPTSPRSHGWLAPGCLVFFWIVKRLTEKTNWYQAVRLLILFTAMSLEAHYWPYMVKKKNTDFWRMLNHPSSLDPSLELYNTNSKQCPYNYFLWHKEIRLVVTVLFLEWPTTAKIGRASCRERV